MFNFTQINSSIVDIYLSSANVNLTWFVKSFDGLELHIQLNFSDPIQISSGF